MTKKELRKFIEDLNLKAIQHQGRSMECEREWHMGTQCYVPGGLYEQGIAKGLEFAITLLNERLSKESE